MTLHDKIQALRRARGLSQEEVADALNVSRQAVSKWETGQSYPSTENLIALAALFESSADELLELARDEKTDAPEMDEKKEGAPDSVPADPPENKTVGSEKAGTDDEMTSQEPAAPQSPALGWPQKLWTGLKYALAVAGIVVFAIGVFKFVTGSGLFVRSDALAPQPLVSSTVSTPEPTITPYASASPEPTASGDALTVYQAFQSIQNEGATPQMRLLARETIFSSLETLDWASYSGFAARTRDGNAAVELCGWLSEQQSLTAVEVKCLLLGGAGRAKQDGVCSDAYDAALAHLLINYPQTFCKQLAAAGLTEYEWTTVITGTAYGASETEDLRAQARQSLKQSAAPAGSSAERVVEKLRIQLELRRNATVASEPYPTPEPTSKPTVQPLS